MDYSVVSDQLYISGRQFPQDKENIKKEKISHVVSLTLDPVIKVDGVQYLTFAIADHCDVEISKLFDETCKFISKGIENKKKVLVHCDAGISRSATIVLAFLMQKDKKTLSEAMSHLLKVRPIVWPNLGFVNQLTLFEKKLFPKIDTSIFELYYLKTYVLRDLIFAHSDMQLKELLTEYNYNLGMIRERVIDRMEIEWIN